MAGEPPFTTASNWPVVPLREISLKIGSGATPTGGAETYLNKREKFALIRSQNVFDRQFDENGLAFISDAQENALRNAALQERDVLLNITGDGVTFGRACMVPTGVLPACVNQHVSIIRVDPLRADAGFVLSYLTHPLVKPYIESFNAGGSRRAITKGHIESFAVPLPPLPEQKRIAHILGTLDDKIELNRRMNATLEGISRAIFKSWFVDFDPVRQKAAGKQPVGMDAQTAALFPDSFEDSEIGEVPTGWRAGTIGDCVDVVDCLHTKKPERVEDGKPLLQLANIRDDGLLDMADTFFISDEDFRRWSAKFETQVACIGNPDPGVMKVNAPLGEETFDDTTTTETA